MNLKVSVIIPVYNSAKTIEKTLASVLCQTVPPEEILILDDGSTDNTVSILSSYREPVKLFRQENRGVAAARNTLCRKARGDLIAFLDADDLWHPRYLERQAGLFARYSSAVGFFTWHVNFSGYGDYEWDENLIDVEHTVELISPLDFLKRYNACPGPFASMSYCCVPKAILAQIGDEPFCESASGADDFYFFNLLPRWGPIAYTPVPLVAYRGTPEAQSLDQLKVVGLSVKALEVVRERYGALTDESFRRVLRDATATRRRSYAKILMGTGNVREARGQLIRALHDSGNFASKAKSTALFFLTCMPLKLQPTWPRRWRD